METYTQVWEESQNKEAAAAMAQKLIEGQTIYLELQPGDMTCYEFLIAPVKGRQGIRVSNDGRSVETCYADGSYAVLPVTLGKGVQFVGLSPEHNKDFEPGHLYDLEIHNPCTMAALVGALNAIQREMK